MKLTKVSADKKHILVLTIALVLLLGYNFIKAADWTAPSGNPPTNNVDVPINTGSVQ